MRIFEEYFVYIRDSPKGYWFKRKLYGWGWVPARKEGWYVIWVYVFAVAVLGGLLGEHPTPNRVVFGTVLPVLVLTAGLIYVCYKKGQKPRWQWGREEKEVE